MKDRRNIYIPYLILFTVFTTIAIQVYWNLGNYKTNKQALINDVQDSFDTSVEGYYANLAKTDFFAFLDRDTLERKRREGFLHVVKGDSLFKIDFQTRTDTNLRTVLKRLDSAQIRLRPPRTLNHMARMRFFRKKMKDSTGPFRKLFNTLITSATTQNLDFTKLDSLLNQELLRKDIAIDYQLRYFENDSLLTSISRGQSKNFALTTFSTSNFLIAYQKLELNFSNPTLAILRKSLTGIILSFILSASIIYCLFYLLRVINQQKQLSEIKNDLISNITHEFKTPITTVSTAIEGIKNFNSEGDMDKTEKYLDISEKQLKKLHSMVEKLLETATLDSEKLVLDLESQNLVSLLGAQVDKFKMISDKTVSFESSTEQAFKKVDSFHFENVISNLLDNAIKYGGDIITVSLNSSSDSTEITIVDNGKGIPKEQQERIFEKFYRIPTGNRHDVKGFGIGLYYAKKIMEKHAGDLVLILDDQNTIFKITL